MTWMQRLRESLALISKPANGVAGQVKVIASVEDSLVIERIRVHLNEKAASSEANGLPGGRAPPQAGLFD
jgi:hypothetical protein